MHISFYKIYIYRTDLGTGGEQIDHTDQVAQVIGPFQIT